MVLLPFVVGILLMLLSILFMVAIFLLCYTWAQYFLGNLNNLVAPAASSSSQPPASFDDETSTVNQIILDPAILQSIIFKMKLHEAACSGADPPIVYMPGEARPTFIAFPSPYTSSRNEDTLGGSTAGDDIDEVDTNIPQQLQNPALYSHNNGVSGESDHERQAGGRRSILSPSKLAADHESRLQIH